MSATVIHHPCPECGHEWVCEFGAPGGGRIRECLNPTCDHWGYVTAVDLAVDRSRSTPAEVPS